jgi:plastocyanin
MGSFSRLVGCTIAVIGLGTAGAAWADDGQEISPRTGAIAGVARCEGRVPTMQPIDMNFDPICAGKHDGDEPALNESILVDEEGHLANVLVRVVEGLPEGDYPVPQTPLILSQEGCMYHPRVFGIRPGQPLTIQNPDGTIHNVNGMPVVNRGFNLAMDARTTEKTITLEQPEPPFPIKCDVHPWMRAYCAVVDHPFFAVSGPAGAFTIAELPPGTYVLEAWHERYGIQREEVTVAAGEETPVTFTFRR